MGIVVVTDLKFALEFGWKTQTEHNILNKLVLYVASYIMWYMFYVVCFLKIGKGEAWRLLEDWL